MHTSRDYKVPMNPTSFADSIQYQCIYAYGTSCRDKHAHKWPKLLSEINVTSSKSPNEQIDCYPQLTFHSNAGFNLHFNRMQSMEFNLWTLAKHTKETSLYVLKRNLLLIDWTNICWTVKKNRVGEVQHLITWIHAHMLTKYTRNNSPSMRRWMVD